MLNLPVPLLDLAQQLAAVLANFEASKDVLGRPEFVRTAAEESEKIFQGYAKARPSKEDAYAAAVAFMRGHSLDDRQRDLVGAALSEQIQEFKGARPLGSPRLPELLSGYERDANAGDLWRLTWFGMLCSYFAFDALKASQAERSGWEALRAFLERSWPLIDRQTGSAVVPDWVKVLRTDPDLLTPDAARKYALDYVLGSDEAVKRLSLDLSIPESSWFWHALVLSAVRRTAEQPDERFKAAVPKLIGLIKERPVFRDEALEVLLTRYHRCAQTPVHEQLRNFVVHKDVWRNPKLRAAGLATAWNRVPDSVWQMVLNWVNERNLKAFFEILATRNSADEGRLAFWSKYLDQISWTRLIFSNETTALARSNAEIRELLAGEEGAYATLSGNKTLDAFMMQIGDYVIIEFSTKGNAAYVYASDGLRFDRHAAAYHGGTMDLRYGFYDGAAMRIVHKQWWEIDAEYGLKQLGIYPDSSDKAAKKPQTAYVAPPAPSTARSATANRAQSPEPWTAEVVRSRDNGHGSSRAQALAPKSARFTMNQLLISVGFHKGAAVNDMRSGDGSGGRLWVEDPGQSVSLSVLLKGWGFRWSDKRSAYYFPEN